MFPYEDSKTLSVCPYPEKRNHPSFVNINPTLLIDTSMKRSSRVLQHEIPKIEFSFQKRSELNFDLFRSAEIALPPSFVNINPTVVIDKLLERWKPQKIIDGTAISCTFMFRQVYTIEPSL